MVLFDTAINLLEGIGCKQNINEGISIMKKLANEGNYEAQFCLARFYWDGQYLNKNNEKAIFWYTKTAENGHPFAQLWLGNNYMNGTKTEVDYQKAVYWYKKAAANKVPMAYYNLGICYYYGLGIERDKAEGERLISLAAENYVLIADLMLMENIKYNYNVEACSQEKIIEKYNRYIGVDKEITKSLANAFRIGYGVNLDRQKARLLYSEKILDSDDETQHYRKTLGEIGT